jgi:mannose-6-phosphate isomerase-like protein (cupin superfamily)
VPVLRNSMSGRPQWCELEDFRIVRLSTGDSRAWHAPYPANKLVVVDGACRVDLPVGPQLLERGASVDLAPGTYTLLGDAVTIVELGGHWGADQGGAGVFGVERAHQRHDIGDPPSYPKHTNFDRHYHDCDEYWIIVAGAGTASSEDVLYDVGPGDCVATRMGDHHDFPLVEQPVSAVFFETTMRGRRRRGHLWEHTHGPAKPATEIESTGEMA